MPSKKGAETDSDAEEKRHYRTHDQIVTDFIVNRFNRTQRVSLIRLKGFEDSQSEIRNSLKLENGLPLSLFREIHTDEGCNIVELPTGREIRLVAEDLDFGLLELGLQPILKLHCFHQDHDVASVEFYRYYGEIKEGPFKKY